MERNEPAATDGTAAVGADRANRTGSGDGTARTGSGNGTARSAQGNRVDRNNRGDDPEEFDPVGTLALILVYFGILVAAWMYVYFVEFLSRDLVVIG